MMFHLGSPSSVTSPMSPEFVPSAMRPRSSQICRNEGEVWSGDSEEEKEEVVEEEVSSGGEEEEEVLSGHSEEEDFSSGDSEEEEEVSSGSSKKESDEIDTNEDGNEATENCEDRVEEPKMGMKLIDKTEIRLQKTYDSLQIEVGGPDQLAYVAKDCQNNLDKLRRLRLVEGDAGAMNHYFMRMTADNSNFFYAMHFDKKNRLRNLFWADARSKAAFKEFGDVVTFDTTYLVNKYDMPFAPFVGVNHHGQSILFGCALISHEDTESFSWLFQTLMTCMRGCAPKAIITDQCMAMKNAIEIVFPNTRHRWSTWHIMKKVSEKLSGYNSSEEISWFFRHTVYDSLTIEEFEDAWDVFIKRYELQDNTWLNELYLERKRWVPAYVKDVFWAGMSSTQSRENMNAYFDGYIHSKTTIKQFLEQYENALAKKVESEKQEDVKSWNSYIPCITEDELEKQFQSVYTNEKVKEFHEQFLGKLNCSLYPRKEGDVSEYEVKEWVTFVEGEEKKRKHVSFTVDFNAETNEAHCNCRLFESRGILCRHQLLVFHEREIDRVPEKYVLRRWCKNVKRVHTKVRINYDNSSTTIEARRHDNVCNLFSEAADWAEDNQEKYDMVMTRLRELKRELIEMSVVRGSNMVYSTPNDSFSLGDGVLPSKLSTNIIDPEALLRKGRSPFKRKQDAVEKAVKKERESKKKTLSNEKAKEVGEIGVAHVFGAQESVVNSYPIYMGQLMWPNMMLYNMRPNMAQGGIGFTQQPFMHNFQSSQSYMQSLLNCQVWRGQSSITDNQVWGGPQPSVLEGQGQGQGQGQGLGGPQQSLMGSRWQGWGGGHK